MNNFSWKCPYCNHHATITNSNLEQNDFYFHKNNKDGHLEFKTKIIIYPNEKCKEYMIESKLRAVTYNCSYNDYTY